MIPQMIVHIVHTHIENHARPQFIQVFHRSRSFCLKHRGYIHITHMLAVSGLEQTHGRDERNTNHAPAVEALHKQNIFPRHLLELNFRGTDARSPRQLEGHIFPERDATVIIVAGKLGNEQFSICSEYRGFGARAAKRGAGDNQHAKISIRFHSSINIPRGAQQPGQRDEGRHGTGPGFCKKTLAIIGGKTNGPLPGSIVDPEQKIGIQQGARLAVFRFGPRAFLSAEKRLAQRSGEQS